MSAEKNDKHVERGRYELRAAKILSKDQGALSQTGLSFLPIYLRAPYICYENFLTEKIKSGDHVLEIGSGSGQHTDVIVRSGAKVIATDISPNSLALAEQRLLKSTGRAVKTKVADMEKLPFDDDIFDFVVSAGSLSYGENDLVLNEIYRVLKLNGSFICVDSLNHNPAYMFNRWIHFLRGARSKSTLKRMPRLSLLIKYEKKFGSCEIDYFGSIVWAAPILKIFGDRFASIVIDRFDNISKTKKSAFKFVMCVKKVK